VFTHHFAYALKKIATDCFDWDGEKDDKGRRLLQVLGTEAGREYNDNIWLDKMREQIEKNVGYANYWLIPDTRFPNEMDFIRCYETMLGMVVEIQRPDLDTGNENYGHSSETALDGVSSDVVIINDGSMDELRSKAKEFVKNLRAGEFSFNSAT